jgi:hypothetical protein
MYLPLKKPETLQDYGCGAIARSINQNVPPLVQLSSHVRHSYEEGKPAVKIFIAYMKCWPRDTNKYRCYNVSC